MQTLFFYRYDEVIAVYIYRAGSVVKSTDANEELRESFWNFAGN